MSSKTNEKPRRGIGPRDILSIIGLAAILWVLRPFIAPIIGSLLQPGQTAVSPAVIIVTPTLAPNAPAAGQGGQTAVSPASLATAVPNIAVTFNDSTGCQNCGPWEVAPAATSPTSTGAGLLRIEAAGRVWEVTAVQLVDCINAQENGLRTGPTCPPNAKQHAGLLGQGR